MRVRPSKCTSIASPSSALVRGHKTEIYDDYADAGTSMNMSIGVQPILRNPLRPGVWAAEEYFRADVFFAELRKRHFAIEIETETVETC